MGFSGDQYPLVMTNIAIWKIKMFHGKIHYFDWVMFNSYVFVFFFYQRVKSHTTNWKMDEGGPFIVDVAMKHGLSSQSGRRRTWHMLFFGL